MSKFFFEYFSEYNLVVKMWSVTKMGSGPGRNSRKCELMQYITKKKYSYLFSYLI